MTSVGGLPMLLVTRDPDVKTLKDFTDKDKIAVPTIKVSSQAMVLKMAMEKMYGEAARDKLDAMTVQLGHPDAMIAVVGGSSEVNSHFSAPPYQFTELKTPGVHLVLDSSDVFGGPASNAVVFGTRKFYDANPKTIAAFIAALEEANAADRPRSRRRREDLPRCDEREVLGRRSRRHDQGAERRLFDDAERDDGVRQFHVQDRADQDPTGDVEGVFLPGSAQLARHMTRATRRTR